MKKINTVGLVILGLLLSIYANGQCDLPSELPSNLADLETANKAIAECFAPTIHQMADAATPISEGGKADLITSAFYDNSIFSDNWNNLSNFEAEELLPHVYYSVVWTDKTWIVTYGFYHPRDYAPVFNFPNPVVPENLCCADNHEHDFEGAFFVINRNSETIQIAGSISHFDVYMDINNFGSTPPDVYIDDRTHAVRLSMDGNCIDEEVIPITAAPCDDCKNFENGNHVVYTYNGGVQSIDVSIEGDLLTGSGTYYLEDIFGMHSNSLGNLRNNSNYFYGDKFLGLGDADCEGSGTASAPWGWSQLTYSNEEILKLTCASNGGNGFSVVGNSVQSALSYFPVSNFCNDPLFYEFESNVEYNPYFEVTYTGCNNSPEDIDVIVSEDQTWNGLLLENQGDQFRSITVRNNSVLTIESYDLRMLLPGEIIVKSGSTLILDQSIIRPCDDQDRWRGIFLENGAKIEIVNGSKIEQSSLGIYNNENLNSYLNSDGTMDAYSLLHNISETAGNNSILIDNSTLNNNYNSLTIDGDNNEISILDNSQISESNLGIVMRGNDTGFLAVESTEFTGNDRSIVGLSCSSENSVHSSTFTNEWDIWTQIELRNVDHLDFQMNEMDGPGYHISSFESHVDIVNNNQFLNSKTAVWVSGSYPLAASARIGEFEDENGDEIESNSFSGNDNGIKVNGLNSAIGGRLQNNYIENTENLAIDVNGISLSQVNNNTIYNSEDGIYFSKTGDNIFNYVNCNSLENNNHQDLTIELDNSESVFLQNDFSNSDSDGNIVLSEAQVRNLQGVPDNPSDNCFNQSADEDLFTDANTSFFQYYHNQNVICRIPSENGNYQALSVSADGANCDENGVGSNLVNPNPPNTGLEPAIKLSPPLSHEPPMIIGPNVDDAISNLTPIGGDDPYTYPDESIPNTEILPNTLYSPAYLANIVAIYTLENELDYWIRLGIHYAIRNNDYNYGEQLLLPFKKWRWQEMLYGLYVKSNQLSKARTLLNVLPQNTIYEVKFIELQHINLDRMINGASSITPLQIQTVYEITTGDTPAAGYAIPIYYYLTGVILDSSVPSKGSRTRSDKMTDANEAFLLSPNPTSDYISLQYVNNKNIANIVILDQNLNVQQRLTADNLDKINVSNLPSGWYMLQFVDNDIELINLPFLKL